VGVSQSIGIDENNKFYLTFLFQHQNCRSPSVGVAHLGCAGISGICMPNPSIVACIVSEITALIRTWLDRLN